MRLSTGTCLTTIIILWLTLPAGMHCQSQLEKAWDAFRKNDLVESKKSFEAAAQEPSSKEESLLMLSLLAGDNNMKSEAFDYFEKFYEVSADPNPYLYALWLTDCINSDFNVKSNKKLKFLKRLCENNKLNGIVQAYTFEVVARHYEGVNDFDEARDYYKKIGSITRWQLVGEFDNTSAGGFDKDFEPISYPQQDHLFKNKIGAAVKWFAVPELKPGYWLYLNYHFYTDNSIVFAQTFCFSPDDRDAQLRIGTSGSLKAWVNDRLVANEPEERNNGIDTYISEIKLQKGINRILLQVGCSEISSLNFIARITDTSGKPLGDLKYDNIYKPYTQVPESKAESHTLFVEKYFSDRITRSPSDLINYILLAHAYLQNDKAAEARKVIVDAQKISPDNSYLVRLLIQAYFREGNRTQLSIAQETLKKLDPDNPVSLELFFNESYDAKKYEEARGYLNKIEAKFGEDEEVLKKKIRLASADHQIEEMKRLIDVGYDKYPYNYYFVYLKYLIITDQYGYKKQSADILNLYLEDRYNSEAMLTLAKHYNSNGDFDMAVDLLKKLIELNPSAVGYYSKLADQYFQRSQYDKAKQYYLKCHHLAPYVSKFFSDIGQACKELNQTDSAVAYYRQAIVYNPTDYETRHKLRQLLSQKEIFDYFVTPDYYEMYKDSPPAANFPEDNSIILLNEVQKVVYELGGSEERHYFMAKIFTTAGIDDWKEFDVPYSGNQEYFIEKAEVLKKDGNRLKAETKDNQIVFTSLEEGDAIIVIYKLENYQFGRLTDHFWDKHYFSMFYPYTLSKYSLLVPSGKTFSYKMLNGDLKPSVEKKDEIDLYIWEKTNQKAIKYEAFMPNLDDVGEMLHVSTIPDWKFIANWYIDLSKNKAKDDLEVKGAVTSLLAGKAEMTALDKVKAVYNYIVKNIRYSYVPFRQSGIVPQKASKVLNTKIGDCKDVSTLFVAMCKEIGVDASLVLIDPREKGRNDLALPSIEFDHVIAKVKADGQVYYIELTSDYNAFSTITFNLKKCSYLDLSPDTAGQYGLKVLNPKTRLRNDLIRTGVVSFDGSKMLIDKYNIKTGGIASAMRSNYRDVGKENQEKYMQQAISPEYPTVKLTSLAFDDNLMTTSDSLTYKYSYTVSNVFSKINNLMIFKLPFADYEEYLDFLSVDNRRFPVEFWQHSNYDFKSETLTVNIPSDKKLAEIPKDVRLSCFAADYLLEFKLNAGKLNVKRQIVLKSDYVPLEKYNEFKTFFERVQESDSQQIAFKSLK